MEQERLFDGLRLNSVNVYRKCNGVPLKKSIAGIKDILRDILNHKETDKKIMTT